MNQNESISCLTGALTNDGVPSSEKHCVVRIESSWYSVPAESVREITLTPDLVALPQCHPSLAGLCHLRSEFIPVVDLDAVLESGSAVDPKKLCKLLIVSDPALWGMLISEVAAIESLETLVAQEARGEDGNQSPILGTAMFRDRIIRVLDPNTVFRLAQQELEDHWRRPDQLFHTAR